ncbi:MAG: hypothetical protein HQ583_08530 [Candidatus Abyssubacteria bacterium]|nr:hypothetical protein [Candidatus Abyssubacteria bacterium]
MRLKLAFTILICALVPIATGCARNRAATAAEAEGSEQITTGIPLAPDFRIADIPIPAGFEFVRDASFVFQNSTMDVGRIQYVGKEQIEDVAQFYLDEMARYNWTLFNVAEYGAIMLFFEKPDKSCQVLLSPKARGSTLIQISFFPKPAQQES